MFSSPKVLACIAVIMETLFRVFSGPTPPPQGGPFYSGCGGVRGRRVFGGRPNRHPRFTAVLSRRCYIGGGRLRLAGGIFCFSPTRVDFSFLFFPFFFIFFPASKEPSRTRLHRVWLVIFPCPSTDHQDRGSALLFCASVTAVRVQGYTRVKEMKPPPENIIVLAEFYKRSISS